MHIHYTGKLEEMTPAQDAKIQERIDKIGRLLDGKNGDKEAHVILRMERHVHQAEITLNYFDHGLVGTGDDVEQFNALTMAFDKLLKQALRVRTKRRDTRREAKYKFDGAPVAVRVAEEETYGSRQPDSVEADGEPADPQVFVNTDHRTRKPMTVEEALIEIEIEDAVYFAYCEAGTDRLHVLIRRPDGDFDLVQA